MRRLQVWILTLRSQLQSVPSPSLEHRHLLSLDYRLASDNHAAGQINTRWCRDKEAIVPSLLEDLPESLLDTLSNISDRFQVANLDPVDSGSAVGNRRWTITDLVSRLLVD